MVLLLEDVGHLNAVRSPFFTLACKFENNQDTTIWFASECSDAIGHATMDEDAFWKFLTECLHESPSAGIPLLDGLGKDEAKRFLALGTELRGKPGDTIVRAGADATTASIRYRGSSSNIASPAGVISRRTARRSELPRKRRTYPFPSSAISVCEIVPLVDPRKPASELGLHE